MGYSTLLYAVDIGELRSAVGSKDTALLERVRLAIQGREGGERPADPTKGPRVLVTGRSEIFLNGRLVTPDEFKQALLGREWAGTYLSLYQPGPPRGQQREGEFKEPGSFMRFLGTLGPYFEEHGLIFKKHIIGINACTSEEQFADLPDPDGEITDDQALEELIAGKFTRRDCGHVYGYALENLCLTIGTFLDAAGTDRLQSLQLKTPLSKTRPPVKLPKIEDFPYISFLDAAELRAEVDRLREMDLSYPRDRDVEDERRHFLRLLEAAAGQGRGVVGFYH